MIKMIAAAFMVLPLASCLAGAAVGAAGAATGAAIHVTSEAVGAAVKTGGAVVGAVTPHRRDKDDSEHHD